jgi:hypothetical protein
MVMARVNQYLHTLNTSSDALFLPVQILNELFKLKNLYPEGYSFILFSPENAHVNSFGMSLSKNNKPVVLFNEIPNDPVEVFFYKPEQLNISESEHRMLETTFEKMLETNNVKNIIHRKTDPWWLFTWI